MACCVLSACGGQTIIQLISQLRARSPGVTLRYRIVGREGSGKRAALNREVRKKQRQEFCSDPDLGIRGKKNGIHSTQNRIKFT